MRWCQSRAACHVLVVSVFAAAAAASQARVPLPGARLDAPEALKNSAWSRLRRLDLWPADPVAGTHQEPIRPAYEEDVVVRFDAPTPEYEAALGAGADSLGLDVWAFGPNFTDIRLPRTRLPTLLRLLPASHGTAHRVLIEDLAGAVAATYPATDSAARLESALSGTPEADGRKKPGHRRNDVDQLFFRDYQRVAVIVNWMSLLDSMFHGRGLVHYFSIGKSAGGLDIPALRIGRGLEVGGTKEQPRKTMLITGGMHAREWISISTVNYLAWSFVSAYGQDPLVTRILDEFDIVFVPVLNPDGYEFTWTTDRLWRKTRQETRDVCPGYDLDHSFGYQWDVGARMEEPCSPSYGGAHAFEAVEALQLADWAKNETENNNVTFTAYLDLHSYSQQILWPYAYSCAARVPNLENMMEVAMNIAKYMRLSSGEVYTVDSACEGGYTARRAESLGGSAVDYFFHDLQARYSYQIKLRDRGTYGFLLPPSHIIATGEEVFQAMKYFGDFLLGNNGHEWAQQSPGGGAQEVLGDEGPDRAELRK